MNFSQVTPFLVFLQALITALATGLGALPFVLVKGRSARTIAWSHALAAGLMLGACFGLLFSGREYGERATLIGAVLGILFILATEKILHSAPGEVESLQQAGGRRKALIMLSMTVHSVAEGIAVGAAFGGDATLGIMITVAIAIHNIPEGLAITAVLRPQGVSLPKCAALAIFSSLPQPLFAVPAYLFVDFFTPTLPYGLGFAAGAMTLMVLIELLPEAYEEAPRTGVSLLTSLSLVAMLIFQRLM